jgi:hypothetical protein
VSSVVKPFYEVFMDYEENNTRTFDTANELMDFVEGGEHIIDDIVYNGNCIVERYMNDDIHDVEEWIVKVEEHDLSQSIFEAALTL